MRVLQLGKFYSPHHGGMETVLKDICECLHQRVELTTIVANDGRARMEESIKGVWITRLANWGTVFSQPITPRLLHMIKTVRSDIVHLHAPNPLAMLSYALAKAPGKLVVHYHSDIVRQKRLAKLYGPGLDRALARADAIIVGSHELLDMSPVLAKWRDKCVVIPFGVDLQRFASIDRSAGIRNRSASRARILAVGRLTYYKGFEYLIRSMATIDAELTIAGDGELRLPLTRLISELGLGDRVRLRGAVSERELLTLYGEADLFCLPSCEPSEAFGLVMIEAMACGLPVVSTDLPTGVRAVNRHNVTGLVVPPGDVPALGEAINLLLSDPKLSQELGAAGRIRAYSHFNRNLMAARILQLYGTVLNTAEVNESCDDLLALSRSVGLQENHAPDAVTVHTP
jgi:glycosyltransferase involved in cell wall biosynthesis